MPITLDQYATLAHINIRKEGPGDEKHLMVDLKLQMKTDSDILLEFDPALRGMLFREGEVRFPKMAPIKWAGEMRHMELEIAGVEFLDVTLRKFQFEPIAIVGQEFVDLSFLATFAPGGSETAILAEQVGEETAIKVRAGPELDLAPKEGDVAAAARKLREQLVEDGASMIITTPEGRSVTLGGQDDLYPKAVDAVKASGRVSITHLQRELRIGYNRAARLMEQMEQNGVVTAMDASGQRDLVA
ncbi:MAG: DNA translocase FtsK [Pseudomonadota bacterium]|nr:DNA translocase FtsK [Pseudomonadota bacterium]MDP1905027.1 DNA translocase FtsK [Pseudomonadota bacterium]MDP2354269.1 DNA translocase FtsK [Pseudomonadota bacterium]